MRFLSKLFGVEKRSQKDSFDVFDSLPTLNLSGSLNQPNKIPALNQGVRIIADSIATLPIECKANNVVDNVLHRPNQEQTTVDFLTVLVNSLLWTANGYIEKQYGPTGRLIGLVSHHYRQISVERIQDGHRYRYTDIYGNTRVILEHEMIHIRYNSDDKVFGRSPVQECIQALGIANAQQAFIQAYNNNGSKTGGILSTDKHMSPDSISKFKKAWEDRHQGPENANRVSVLTDGFKYDSVGHTVLEADFIRQYNLFAVQEVSRVLNIPPTLLNDYSNSTYTNSETARKFLYEITLRPYMTLIEAALTAGLGLPREMAIKFDTSSILRMNPLDQANAAVAIMNAGVMTVNEWRAKHDLPPINDPSADLLPMQQAAPVAPINGGGQDEPNQEI